MFKKKNKNLHRALIALMVLGLLVCLCFTLASAATAELDSSSAAETTAVEEQGAQSNTEAMTNFLNQAGIATLIHNADWKSIVMILISFVLMYLAIGKGFEPLLLLPIAFGMLLTNLPGAGMFHSEIFEGGHIHWDLIKNGAAPADSKLSFRLTENERFNGEYTDKPLFISSSGVGMFVIVKTVA